MFGIAGIGLHALTSAGVISSKLSMQIQSGMNAAIGIGLMFVPGAQGVGASLIGAGLGGFAGGYISEAFGGSYAFGWGIGSIVGGILGGQIYQGIQHVKAARALTCMDDVATYTQCFSAGTLVLTEDGQKAIEEIEVGDKV